MNMIKKKTLCKKAWLVVFVLMVSMLVSACSSSNGAGEDETGSSAAKGAASEESNDSESSEEELIYNYTYCWNYTNENAWVCYIGDDVRYMAVIDKTGEMLYKYDTGFSKFTADEAKSMVTCQDGYA